MIKTYLLSLIVALVATQTLTPPSDGYFFYSDFYLSGSKGYHTVTV